MHDESVIIPENVKCITSERILKPQGSAMKRKPAVQRGGPAEVISKVQQH